MKWHTWLSYSQDIVQQREIKAETVRRCLRKGPLQGIVHVVDTDIGFDPEQQADIFDGFYRVDCSRARHKGEVGVLLPLYSET